MREILLAGIAGVLRRPRLDETGGISEDEEEEERTGLLER